MLARLSAAMSSAALLIATSSCASVAPAARAPASTKVTASSAPAPPQPGASKEVAAPSAVPPAELATLELGSRVGEYAAHSAVWIAGQPIAVNHDFDFATALGVELGGTGIAAAQRARKNAERAQRLATLPAVEPQALLKRLCAESRDHCAALAGVKVRVYGLLYGEKDARLRVLLEPVAGAAGAALFASISAARPVDEYARPGVLAQAFAQELARTLQLNAAPPAAPAATAGEPGRCTSGGGTHVAGRVAARDAQRVVLATSDARPALISCELNAFTPLAPAPAEPPAP